MFKWLRNIFVGRFNKESVNNFRENLLKDNAEKLTEQVSQFQDDVEGHEIFLREVSRTLMKTVLAVLCYKRDNNGKFPEFTMDISKIQENLDLRMLCDCYDDNRLPDHDENGMPVKKYIETYLSGLGDFWNKKFDIDDIDNPSSVKALKEKHEVSENYWKDVLDKLAKY